MLLDVERALPSIGDRWIFSVMHMVFSRGVRRADPLSILMFVFCLGPFLRISYDKFPTMNWVETFADYLALILQRANSG